MIQLGIIGVGRIGRLHGTHIQQYLPDAQVRAISDAKLTKEARQWADALGITQIYDAYEEMLKKESLDAVLICSPTPTHIPIIRECRKRDIHVFCEKPLGPDSETIYRLMDELPRKKDLQLQVGFNRRFDHNFAKIKEELTAGTIGDPRMISIISQDPELPPPNYFTTGEGLFMGTSIHDFDMLRFISGSEVRSIQVMTAAFEPFVQKLNEIDSALISLRMESGCLVQVTNSWFAVYGYDQRLEVLGSKGMLRADNDVSTAVTVTTATHTSSDNPLYFFQERYSPSYLQEIRSFVQCIRNGTTVAVGAKDGLMSVIIAEAAEQSRKKGAPVSLHNGEYT